MAASRRPKGDGQTSSSSAGTKPGGAKRGRRRTMSAEQRAAMSEGRRTAHAVSSYLEALERERVSKSARNSPERLQGRLDAVVAELDSGTKPLRKLQLAQQRLDLEQRIAAAANTQSAADFEPGFIDAAARYAQRHQITWAAFREVGVPAKILRAAGVPKSF